jgi:hypothetical protein
MVRLAQTASQRRRAGAAACKSRQAGAPRGSRLEGLGRARQLSPLPAHLGASIGTITASSTTDPSASTTVP